MRRTVLHRFLLCCVCCIAMHATWGQTTFDTMPFRLSAAAEGDSALLRWADLGSGVLYDIYRLMPGEEDFQPIASTDTVAYADVVSRSVCRDTVKYYVSAWWGDTLYMSNRMALVFEDPNPTSSCELELASVDRALQQLVLTWKACPDEDAMGYVIHKGTNGSRQGSLWRPYDTVYGRETTRYVCEGLDLREINAFRIFAFDSCFQASPLTAPYQNMALNAEVPECSRELHFAWSSYINMPGEVGHYDVLLQMDGGEWTTLTTRNTHQPQWGDYTLPAACGEANLLVRAISTDGSDTAWSNMATVTLQTIGSIDYLSIYKVSVSDDNSIVRLAAAVDSTFVTGGYNLYRRQEGDAWSLVGTIPYTGAGIVHYTDCTASPSSVEYYYRLGVPDVCMGVESYSEEANNVLLTVAPSPDNEEMVQIAWTPFFLMDDFEGYWLLRKRESEAEWQNLGQTDTRFYIDDISLSDSIGGAWLYKVIAHGHDTMQSNTVCYAPEVSIWLPNAIVLQQEGNDRFCVKGRHVNPNGYELYIYNRLGQQLYHSTNPANCWDGMLNGAAVPQGSYVYLLKYCDGEGKVCSKKGTVTVLH